MVTVDKQCRDILAKYYLKTFQEGTDLQESFANNKISKAAFLNTLYTLVDDWIARQTSEQIAKHLSEQEYFEFNVANQLAKIDENTHAAFLAEPTILRRVDDEGNHHYVLDVFVRSTDTVIKYLPLNPDQFNLLLDKLEQHNLYSMGLNWLRKPGSPTIIIFGIESYCKELHANLERTYGTNR